MIPTDSKKSDAQVEYDRATAPTDSKKSTAFAEHKRATAPALAELNPKRTT